MPARRKAARKISADRLPLPYPALQLERSLLRLHARIRGEALKVAHGQETLLTPAQIERGQALIEDLLDYLGTGSDPSAIKPIKTWPKVGPFGYGQLVSELLLTLKLAKGQALSIQELSQDIVRRHNLRFEPAEFADFRFAVRKALHRIRNEGDFVVPELDLPKGYIGQEQRWLLNPKRFRNAA